MNTQSKRIGLVLGVLLTIFSLQTLASADAFQFTFATDPIGCVNFSGGCGAVSAAGTLFTDPLTGGPAFGNLQVFPIESITGIFDGLSMSLNNPGQSAIVQSNLNLPETGPGVIFTAGGQQFELEFNPGPHPAGANNLLFDFSNNTFKSVDFTVNPVSVPEPSELALAAAGLLGFAGLKLFKSKTA